MLGNDPNSNTPSHTFSVSEVFEDGRVLVCTYAHVGESINMVMDVYDDATMRNGKRYLDLHLEQRIPTLEQGDDDANRLNS